MDPVMDPVLLVVDLLGLPNIGYMLALETKNFLTPSQKRIMILPWINYYCQQGKMPMLSVIPRVATKAINFSWAVRSMVATPTRKIWLAASPEH